MDHQYTNVCEFIKEINGIKRRVSSNSLDDDDILLYQFIGKLVIVYELTKKDYETGNKGIDELIEYLETNIETSSNDLELEISADEKSDTENILSQFCKSRMNNKIENSNENNSVQYMFGNLPEQKRDPVPQEETDDDFDKLFEDEIRDELSDDGEVEILLLKSELQFERALKNKNYFIIYDDDDKNIDNNNIDTNVSNNIDANVCTSIDSTVNETVSDVENKLSVCNTENEITIEEKKELLEKYSVINVQ